MSLAAAGAFLLLQLAAGPPLGPGPRVEVWLLGHAPPQALALAGGGRVRHLQAEGDRLFLDGAVAPSPLRLADGDWRLRVPGEPERRYRAALAVRAEAGRLRLDASIELEHYVAQVVASEAAPGTPPQALAALAVVVRSWALAARGRHPGGGRCDLAHCQRLDGTPAAPGPLAAALLATRATAGVVLRLPAGEVAAAPFHAACGGHTADPALAFGGEGTGAAAVEDPACGPARWSARLTPGQLAEALRGALGRAGWAGLHGAPDALHAGELAVVAGPGGWVAQVAATGGGWRLAGDAAARALDAALGRGRVRSSRFTLRDEEGWVVVRGGGHGHGVGLCQEGAARRARAGAGWREILEAYFPRAAARAPGPVAALGAPDGRWAGRGP